jgi:hypothetical protein
MASNPNFLIDADGRYQGRAAALAKELIAVLTAQRDIYLQLAELARQQSAYIRSGASEDLMTVLAARARLVEQLTPLDRQLQPHKDRWPEVLETLAPPQRGAVSLLLTQVQQLLADLLEQDEADRQVLLEQKTDVGAQLSKTVTGRQLHRAYGGARGPRPSSPGMGIG